MKVAPFGLGSEPKTKRQRAPGGIRDRTAGIRSMMKMMIGGADADAAGDCTDA